MEQKTLRYAVLHGSYPLTIDDKNRLVVPSDIRKAIDPVRDGTAFYVIVGVNRKPWFYPELYYQERVFQQTPEMIPSEEQLALDHMNFGMANKVEWDKQGRISIPEKTLRRSGLNKEVTLVGAKDHLELWDRAEWESWEEELDRRRVETFLKARNSQQQSPQ